MGEADDADDDRDSLLSKKKEFFESFFRKGAEITRELLAENDRLRRRIVDLEDELERENGDLASLYVAQSQLHASLDPAEVVRVIMEIALNFVGAQRFAIYQRDGGGALHVLAAEGVDPERLAPVSAGQGAVGAALADGALLIDGEAPTARREPGTAEPSVCVPLRHRGRVIGVLAIWCFLRQKAELTDLDRRLLELLADGGGHALEAARLAGAAGEAT
ncbi:MAG TPA: GAF domain-containing protein [Kofleriaceae bacterium]|nr:GAF domain-containing protein [Kofleriaceae bacterium]